MDKVRNTNDPLGIFDEKVSSNKPPTLSKINIVGDWKPDTDSEVPADGIKIPEVKDISKDIPEMVNPVTNN